MCPWYKFNAKNTLNKDGIEIPSEKYSAALCHQQDWDLYPLTLDIYAAYMCFCTAVLTIFIHNRRK